MRKQKGRRRATGWSNRVVQGKIRKANLAAKAISIKKQKKKRENKGTEARKW